jgi:hypothetical protein
MPLDADPDPARGRGGQATVAIWRYQIRGDGSVGNELKIYTEIGFPNARQKAQSSAYMRLDTHKYPSVEDLLIDRRRNGARCGAADQPHRLRHHRKQLERSTRGSRTERTLASCSYGDARRVNAPIRQNETPAGGSAGVSGLRLRVGGLVTNVSRWYPKPRLVSQIQFVTLRFAPDTPSPSGNPPRSHYTSASVLNPLRASLYRPSGRQCGRKRISGRHLDINCFVTKAVFLGSDGRNPHYGRWSERPTPADSRMRVSILLFRFITRQQCQCSFSEHHYVDGPISTIYFDNESLIQRFDIRKTGHSERHTQRYLHPLVRHSVNVK